MKTHALSTAILLFGVSACGQTTVRPLSRSLDASIARPSRILLQTFAVSEAQVNEYQGILRQQPSNNNAMERRREIGKRAAEALAVELVNRLRALSFTVERVSHETLVTDNDLLVEGQFLSVDEGVPLGRVLDGRIGRRASRLLPLAVFRQARMDPPRSGEGGPDRQLTLYQITDPPLS